MIREETQRSDCRNVSRFVQRFKNNGTRSFETE